MSARDGACTTTTGASGKGAGQRLCHGDRRRGEHGARDCARIGGTSLPSQRARDRSSNLCLITCHRHVVALSLSLSLSLWSFRLHCSENLTAILFVAALSEYNQTLKEDETQNRLVSHAVRVGLPLLHSPSAPTQPHSHHHSRTAFRFVLALSFRVNFCVLRSG